MSREEAPIGAVVVGTGCGLFTHVRALRDAGFDVRAIVGRNKERTAERAAPLGIPLASDSLEQVLANDRESHFVGDRPIDRLAQAHTDNFRVGL